MEGIGNSKAKSMGSGLDVEQKPRDETQVKVIPFYWDKIKDRLNNMRKQMVFTDVILKCQGKSFQAHRNILCCASQYFYNMFSCGLKESVESIVEFPTIESVGLELILNILYSGKMIITDFETARQALMAAHLMQLDAIFDFYRNMLVKDVAEENFLQLWNAGDELNDNIILQAIYFKIKEFYRHDDFLQTSGSQIKGMFQFLVENVLFPDELLLKILIRWMSVTKDCRLIYFSEFINFIHFGNICMDQLSNILQDPFLNVSDSLKDKFFSVFYNAYFYISKIEDWRFVKECVVNIYALGRNSESYLCVQKSKLGYWSDVPLNHDIHQAALVGESHLLRILTVEKGMVFLNTLNKKGTMWTCKELDSKLEIAFVNAVLCGEEIITVNYVPGLTSFKFNKYLPSGEVIKNICISSYNVVKIQLLSRQDDIYRVVQWMEKGVQDNGIILSLTFYSADEGFRLLYTDWIKGDNENSDWFAYIFQMNIVIRFFPGKTAYFNLCERSLRYTQENNNLNGVTSLRIKGETAWCLTTDGSIYIQDLRKPMSDWKFITKPNSPLMKYQDMILISI